MLFSPFASHWTVHKSVNSGLLYVAMTEHPCMNRCRPTPGTLIAPSLHVPLEALGLHGQKLPSVDSDLPRARHIEASSPKEGYAERCRPRL